MKRGYGNLSIIILINVILIFAISLVSAVDCNDSDNGEDYYNVGYVNITGSSDLKDDYCINNHRLLESHCNSDSTLNRTEYVCPYGCLNGSCQEKQESINLKQGWNLVSLTAFKSLFNTSDTNLERDLDNLGLDAIYIFDKTNNKYIRIHPSINRTKYNAFIASENEAITNTAIWVYAKRDLTHKFKDVLSFPASLGDVNLTRGWNFLTFVPNMTGNSLNEWIGDCEVETASIWSETGQGWDTADETKGDFNANLPSDLLWKGLVLKVSNDCTLENPEDVSPTRDIRDDYPGFIDPGSICTDTDRGRNLLEEGTVIINLTDGAVVESTDECMTNDTLREFYCNYLIGGLNVTDYGCENNCSNGACIKPNANNNLIETDIEGFIFSNILIDNCILIADSNCSRFIAEYDTPLRGFNSLITIIEDHNVNNFTNNQFVELETSFPGTKHYKNYNENPVLEIVNETSNLFSNLFLWYDNNKTIQISITSWNKTKISEDDLSIFIESYLTKYPSDLYFNNLTTCRDSDGGVVLGTEGNCIDNFGTNITDNCITGNRLEEVYCNNYNKCVIFTDDCANGCSNNKCT